MKKIIFLTDTHGNKKAINSIKSELDSADYIFHAGDHFYDIDDLKKACPEKVFTVYGNCDGGGEEEFFTIEGVKILLVHGDRYKVKFSLLRLSMRAEEIGANLVCFGHTHKPLIAEQNGITYVNAGNMTNFGGKSYAKIYIDNGSLKAEIIKL